MIRKSPLQLAICLATLLLITGILQAQSDCSKVTELSASDISDNAATLSWVGATAHKSFDVDVMHSSGTPNFKFSKNTDSQELTVTGLMAGSKYRFRVKSKCEKGSGGSSKWFEFQTTGDPPGGNGDDGEGSKCPKVTGLEALEISDEGAVLSWKSDPAYEKFQVDVMHAPQNAHFKWSTSTTDTSVMLDNLAPGRSYRFRVRASCVKGKSNSEWVTFSTTGIDSTGHGRCPKASNLAVLDVTDSSVVLTWLGNPENRTYLVDVHQKEHTPTYRLSEEVDTTALEVTGLSPGGNYKFRVKASCEKNSAGSSSWINFVTTGGDSTFNQCPKPRNLSVLEVTDSSALLTWLARDSAISFDLTIKSFEKTASFSFDTTLADTFYLVTGLEPEGNYQFRLKTNCTDTSSSGSSDWSKFRTLADTSSNSEEGSTSDPTVELESATAQVATFPNPVEEELNVILPVEKLGYLTNVILADLTGRVVFQSQFKEVPTSANLPISVDGLTPGIYKLAIHSVGFSQTKTIIIQGQQ